MKKEVFNFLAGTAGFIVFMFLMLIVNGLTEVSKEYIAPATIAAIDSTISRNRKTTLQSTEQLQSSQLAKLNELHPGWAKVINSTEFINWKKTQSLGDREILRTSWDAVKIAEILTRYQDEIDADNRLLVSTYPSWRKIFNSKKYKTWLTLTRKNPESLKLIRDYAAKQQLVRVIALFKAQTKAGQKPTIKKESRKPTVNAVITRNIQPVQHSQLKIDLCTFSKVLILDSVNNFTRGVSLADARRAFNYANIDTIATPYSLWFADEIRAVYASKPDKNWPVAANQEMYFNYCLHNLGA